VTWWRSVLGPLPFAVPGLPGLTGAVLLWGGSFVVSALFVLPLAARAWHGWLVVRRAEDAAAERRYAWGQAIARTCGLLMVLAGLAAGVVAATVPPTLPRRPLAAGGLAVVVALLVLAVLVAVQSIALEASQRAAALVLSRRPPRVAPPGR